MIIGLALGVRYIVFMIMGTAGGHIQSLILASMTILLGFMCWMIGVQADIIAANRKLLEDIQYCVRKEQVDREQDK